MTTPYPKDCPDVTRLANVKPDETLTGWRLGRKGAHRWARLSFDALGIKHGTKLVATVRHHDYELVAAGPGTQVRHCGKLFPNLTRFFDTDANPGGVYQTASLAVAPNVRVKRTGETLEDLRARKVLAIEAWAAENGLEDVPVDEWAHRMARYADVPPLDTDERFAAAVDRLLSDDRTVKTDTDVWLTRLDVDRHAMVHLSELAQHDIIEGVVDELAVDGTSADAVRDFLTRLAAGDIADAVRGLMAARERGETDVHASITHIRIDI